MAGRPAGADTWGRPVNITATALVLLLLIAAVCGAVGQLFAGSRSRGWIVSTGMGLVGAWLGMRMADALTLPTMYLVETPGVDFPVVWSVIGSALLVAVLGVLPPGRRRR